MEINVYKFWFCSLPLTVCGMFDISQGQHQVERIVKIQISLLNTYFFIIFRKIWNRQIRFCWKHCYHFLESFFHLVTLQGKAICIYYVFVLEAGPRQLLLIFVQCSVMNQQVTMGRVSWRHKVALLKTYKICKNCFKKFFKNKLGRLEREPIELSISENYLSNTFF